MDLRRVLSYVRRAADDYQMIEEGDRIAVGISGGKDSLTLLAGIIIGHLCIVNNRFCKQMTKTVMAPCIGRYIRSDAFFCNLN